MHCIATGITLTLTKHVYRRPPIDIQVGTYRYRIELTELQPTVHGRPTLGSCDPVRQRIEVWRALRPDRRLVVGWHEIAHAWRDALDIRPGDPLDDESYAALIGTAMAAMSVGQVARLHLLFTRGIDAREIIMSPGNDHPIPVLQMSEI